MIPYNRKLEIFEKVFYKPNINNPKLFSEKVITRVLKDEDPRYSLYGKKLYVPYFLANRIPKGLKFPRRLKIKYKINPSDFKDMPEKFYLKSSFGSKWNKLVNLNYDNISEICNTFNNALHTIVDAQGYKAGHLENCLIFEEYIPSAVKFEFHCFGDTIFCHYSEGLTAETWSSNFFNENHEKLDAGIISFSYKITNEVISNIIKYKHRPITYNPKKPKKWIQLLNVAKKLAYGFDYVRIDLFLSNDDIYFNEITPYHWGGLFSISSLEWDKKLGDLWPFSLPTYQGEYL